VTAINAPVALFVYNRTSHTRQAIDALRRNELAGATDLIVFSDGPKDLAAEAAVREVRQLIENITGFNSVRIVERPANLGLADSIISGVTEVCGEFGRVIVLEDDLVAAPSFLRFMNDALNFYATEEKVGSIHGYWYPADRKVPETFFLRGASCWGWATWSRAWRLFEPDGRKLLAELERRGLTQLFDLDGAIGYMNMLRKQIANKNNSWAIRWHAAMFLAERLQLSPGSSLVNNIGFDGSGTHRVRSDAYSVALRAQPITVGGIAVEQSAQARAALVHYYRSTRPGIPRRVLGRLRRMFGG
jgi:glycosyltransferase involved in cell wall biosynthesis